MADGWVTIALRFATYTDLMILFGVPLFAVQVLDPRDHATWISQRYAKLVGVAAGVGIVLALLGLMTMGMQMSGASDYASVTNHVLGMILMRTDAGMAWAARIAALLVCLAVAATIRSRPAVLFSVTAAAGAIALATMAWAGHGAMDDGARGYVHLGSDVLHLIAAGAWVGALIAFVSMSFAPPAAGDHSVDMLNRTAAGFGRMGTAIVAALLVSGVVNYVLIAGPSARPLVSTLYGNLLAAKLVLFALMLALAGANRFFFSPGLEAAMGNGNHLRAIRILKRSLRTEASLGFLVLGLVAWLGVLSPQP